MPAKKAKKQKPKKQKVKMGTKLLAYRTRPHENEYYAKKFGVSMEVFRDIVENVNMNGKPARSLDKIENACKVYKQKQQEGAVNES